MVILKHKHEEETKKTEENQEFDTRLDAVKFTSEVHSRIKKDINSDFVLAILTDKDKEGIIEMTANAYFVKRVLDQLANNIQENPPRDQTNQQIIHTINKVRNISKTVFDTYMVRIYMTTLLNRNVPRNHLIKILAGAYEETEEEEPKKAQKGLLRTITEKLKKQQET